jgi:DNA-binding NarL/FixJ family response regulator
VVKSGNPRELIAGIHAVASGGACLSPAIAARMTGRPRDSGLSRAATARAQVQTLTERERDALALLGAGLSNARIAHRLHLVEGTVKGQVSAISPASTGPTGRRPPSSPTTPASPPVAV